MNMNRKERLAALAARAGRNRAPVKDGSSDEETDEPVNTKQRSDIKFRNYTPSDPSLVEEKQEEDSKKREREGEASAEEPVKKKSFLEEALIKAKQDLENSDIPSGGNSGNAELTAMAPKKVNWDLKRDIQPKLDRLEKRTQKAIVQMLRERLAMEADAASEDEGQDDLD